MKLEIEIPDDQILRCAREALQNDWTLTEAIKREAKRQVSAADLAPIVAASVRAQTETVVNEAVREALKTATAKTMRAALRVEQARLNV